MRQHFCSERDADMLSVRIKVLDGFDFPVASWRRTLCAKLRSSPWRLPIRHLAPRRVLIVTAAPRLTCVFGAWRR